jgi:hypothetical protein
MNGSISLLRANPALTTNVKLMVDSEYNLYLESYSANRELSDKKYKKYLITTDSFLSQRIASFYKGLPANIAFDVKNDIKSDVIQSNYNNQFDDIYYSGARAVEDTRYQEEFQYNTTLKINPSKLPKYFIIFRVDGPGLKELSNLSQVPMNYNNWTQPYVYMADAKVTTVFDLTPQTNIGKLWKKNYIDDDLLLRSPVELNFNKFEFSKWNGYDYSSGGTVSKSVMLDGYMQNQNTIFDMESYITDGFKNNDVICSHYSNIAFLFNDTVAGIFYKSETPGQFKYYEKDYPYITKYIQDGSIKSTQYDKVVETLISGKKVVYYTFRESVPYRRKWTINRYSGFYLDDLITVDSVSPYTPVQFKINDGIYLVNNIFRAANVSTADSVNPVDGAYDAQLPLYFKIDKALYLIEFKNNEYVLISDKTFNGPISDFVMAAQKPIKIVYENDNYTLLSPTYKDSYRIYLKNTDNTTYTGISTDSSKIYLIKILDRYYRLSSDYNYSIYINTDEYILCDSIGITRKLGFNDMQYENIQVLTKDNNVTYFDIYQLQFTSISDWDFARENTEYASIEYNKTNVIPYHRPFVYELDIKDTNIPKDPYTEKYYKIWIDDTVNTMSQYIALQDSFVLPCASEYAASGDLYMFDKYNKLTRIWDINQSVVKWGIYESINNMSYPYRINNSLDVCGPYNFTPNIFSPYADVKELTLDWFYSLGAPLNYSLEIYDINTSYAPYRMRTITERSLNIDLPRVFFSQIFNYQLNYFYKFDISYYKNIDARIDYFDYIFNRPVILDNYIDSTNNVITQYYKRIARFTMSDKVNGPAVFAKGLAAYIQYVDTVNPNSNDQFTVKPADDLEGYGFASLFTPRYTDNINILGKAGIEIILNKKYKNVLLNMYVYTLPGTHTSVDYRERDAVYDDGYVHYVGWDDPTLMAGYTYYQSELPVQSLTLKTITGILKTNTLEHPHYSMGIKYTVVEDVVEYTISNMINVYDAIRQTSKITINFSQDLPFKHGEWIHLKNTTYPELDTNHQVVGKNHNRGLIIEVEGDATAIVAAMNVIVGSITCTKEESVYPFRLSVIHPNEIKINKDINQVAGDTSCPVKPKNIFTLNTDILVSYTAYLKNIPHVYVDNDISRRLYKSNSITELSYSQVAKLPSIFRNSGDYEPILHEIDMFEQSALIPYNGTTPLSSTSSGVFYLESDLIGNKYYISIHLTDFLYNVLYNEITGRPNVEIGDIFYVRSSTLPWAQYITGHVIAVELSTVNPVGLPPAPQAYKITLSTEFDFSPILTDIDMTASGEQMIVTLFKYIPSNTAFKFDYINFGTVTELIVSKQYQGVNPMQTSNAIWKTTNKYPMIDEHGVTTINRNIFKSSWDPDFYYKTTSSKYKTKQ